MAAGYQTEHELEMELIEQLKGLRYNFVSIIDESDMLENLRVQLGKHNNIEFNDQEFQKVLNHLNKGGIFDRANTLRDKMLLKRNDGTDTYIEFLNKVEWCQNEYQVTHQVTQEGSYKNRYDVTILVNGLPLCQIELKRRGLGLKEAFHQTNRYSKHSYGAAYGLFRYIQVFVISNGVNTKYYAPSPGKMEFKFTFHWTDNENNPYNDLHSFTNEFLEPCHLSKMITKYIVLHQADKRLMILRPYQYYAVENIIKRVKDNQGGGYIWHTTGSGKTLTSFKASQIIQDIPGIDRVVFVVDRKDLDYQTAQEYNAFSNGSVDSTDNTSKLVQQLTDINNDNKLIVTTIQKLNTAITKKYFLQRMEGQKGKRIIFIFDECHRSQFGDTHKNIVDFFDNAQLFGFTGTPIFADNSSRNEHGKRTTKMLFGTCLHRYTIRDAVRDNNVLKFVVEYVQTVKQKDSVSEAKVVSIDSKEVMESIDLVKAVSRHIIDHHDRKTHGRRFNAILATSSVEMLTKYYDCFAQLKQAGVHNLKIATIYSYGANEAGLEESGEIGEVGFDVDTNPQYIHSRDKLDSYIADYNSMFGTNFSTKDSQSFYSYYQDIARRTRNKEIDILLVVNMFLTGFDAKTLNTIYVDKNLKYHGLIQAFSRTNRVYNEVKSHGNVVCYRNLKSATDEAIGLFSNKDAVEEILVEPYEVHAGKFAKYLEQLRGIAPTVQSVDTLRGEEEVLSFVQTFRGLLRVWNTMKTYTEFNLEDLGIARQEFEDYSSKYIDLKSSATHSDQESILGDVDFELELLHRDEINVSYILNLLAKLHGSQGSQRRQDMEHILKVVAGDVELRSKKELIEKFIQEQLPRIDNPEEVYSAFDSFMIEEGKIAFTVLCQEKGADEEELKKIVDSYLFSQQRPTSTQLFQTLDKEHKPGIFGRNTKYREIWSEVEQWIQTFLN